MGVHGTWNLRGPTLNGLAQNRSSALGVVGVGGRCPKRALRVNLINHLVPAGDLEARAFAMAKVIAGRHREAIAGFKAQARLLMAMPTASPERLEYVEELRRAAYAGDAG
jgi:hypothetical protein